MMRLYDTTRGEIVAVRARARGLDVLVRHHAL